MIYRIFFADFLQHFFSPVGKYNNNEDDDDDDDVEVGLKCSDDEDDCLLGNRIKLVIALKSTEDVHFVRIWRLTRSKE